MKQMDIITQTNGERINRMLAILMASYPEIKTQLSHENPFQLLIATILSAQCTDQQVNKVTKELFKKFKTPEDLAVAPLATIEKLVRSTGFFHNKARHIKKCSKILVEEYGGKVPEKLDDLVKLPGVGRKTANVVLGSAFGMQTIVVDTHVSRLSWRLGLTDQKDPVKIEQALMKIIPRDQWSDFSLRLIYHGRGICTARKPKCRECALNEVCLYPPDKTA